MQNKPSGFEFQGLACERDDRVLFTNLGRVLEPGALLRVAGPNGAGKTTLLRILSGLYEADAGAIAMDGEPISERRHRILYLGHKPQVARDLSVVENLKFLTGLDFDQLQPALKAVGLQHYHDSLVRELSQGQGRRCALARLWCADASLWILDEPYTALDVHMVQVLDQRINDHVSGGGICIFTTHQLPHDLKFDTLELGCVH